MDNLEILSRLHVDSHLQPDVLKAFRATHYEDFSNPEVLESVRSSIDIDGDENYRQLCLILAGILHAYPEYMNRKISEKVYLDTVSDVMIWKKLYGRLEGGNGLYITSWLLNHINLKLFRLGRLQFEPCSTPDEFKSHVKVGHVLNVHIPDDGALLKDQCIESFNQALDFFDLPEATFICDSWLLEPELLSCVSKGSNISEFQSLFEILAVDKTNPQCHQRVFEYSERKGSTLQKNILEREKSGTVFGVGYGFVTLGKGSF